jgi:superfamily II RNA helicase
VATAADVVQIDSQKHLKVFNLLPPEDLIFKPGQAKKGDENTAIVAKLLPVEDLPLETSPEIQEQLTKVADLEAQLQDHPLRRHGDPVNLIKRYNRRTELQADINDRQGKFRKYQAQHWQDFLNLIEILRESDCLQDLTPTPKGLAASAIRGDNELWVGLAIVSGELDRLEPQDLAAVMAALVTETPRPDTWVRYSPPEASLETLYNLRHIRRQLFQLQNRYKVFLPIWLESDLIGIVQQWALGVPWLELCSNTSLDEGDVVRLLRRTVDILSQIPHVPHVSIELQRNAIAAIRMLDRFPVNEALA